MADVTMPQLGETVTEGTITRWLKQVGESIERDEPLFEVSTDKVDSEVPSPAGGVLSEIRVPEGETVDVGTVLAVVSDSAAGAAPAPAAAEPAEAPPAAAVPAAAPAPAPAAAQPEPAPASPLPTIPSQGAPAPQAPPPPPIPPPAATPVPAVAASAGKSNGSVGGGSGPGWERVLSPVVRRLINQYGMDPATLSGTGPGGRITRADVLGVIDARAVGGAPAAAPAPAASGQVAAPPRV
ncbi:MAG: biotin/lipoyl-containing protein, partial [Acidimicrobiales bacterium]